MIEKKKSKQIIFVIFKKKLTIVDEKGESMIAKKSKQITFFMIQLYM